MSEKKSTVSHLVCFSFYCPDSKREFAKGVVDAHDILINPEQGLFYAKDESDKILSQGTIFEGVCDTNTYAMLENVLDGYVFKNSHDRFSRVTPINEMKKLY